jgi:hypothetical protein
MEESSTVPVIFFSTPPSFQAFNSDPPIIPKMVPNKNPPRAPITDRMDRKITSMPMSLADCGKNRARNPNSVISPPNNKPIKAIEPGRKVLKYRFNGIQRMVNPLTIITMAPQNGLVFLQCFIGLLLLIQAFNR